MKRNKYIKIFILLFSIMCNGCSTEENKEEMRQLSEYNINDLSESMKNFMNEASISSANGEHFEVKLLSIAKIKFDDEQYETSYKFYRYQILVAPKLDEKIKLENITFSPSDELVDYYNDVPEGRNSLIDYQLGIENANIKEKVGKENLLAYRLDFTMSNAGDDYQTDSNISNELFDEYMKTLNIKIKFNGIEETISLLINDEMIEVENSDDIPENRSDIKSLFNEGRAISFFAPYQDEELIK